MNLIYLNQYIRKDSVSCPEKDFNTLATENNIQPNLLRNWKREFLNNASAVFDDKREEKLVEERKEKAEYAKKVGQLTMQVD